jgi:hypothetical protein
MAFNHTGEYLVVGSDTETVHLFRCAVPKGAAGAGKTPVAPNRPWSGGWSGSGPSSPSTENAVDGEDMDRVIEQKRRNGSMGYESWIITLIEDKSYGRDRNP